MKTKSTTADTDRWQEFLADLREFVRLLEFEKLSDSELQEMHEATEFAVEDAASEGVFRTGRGEALHKMMIEERLPQEIRDVCVERTLEFIASEARGETARYGPQRLH